MFRVGFARLRCQGNEPLHGLGQGAIRLCQEWPGNGMVAGQKSSAQLSDAVLQGVAGAALGQRIDVFWLFSQRGEYVAEQLIGFQQALIVGVSPIP